MTPERVVIESLFRVTDKRQQDVDFKFNTEQRKIDNAYSRRMLIPKARQEGVTTKFLARNTVKCLGVRNTRAVVISHDTESTERMLLRVKYFLENIKGPKAIIKNNSKNEITFPKTNSMFYIGTAGSRSFGRGDTITDLHCSEVAFWPDTKKTMGGLLQAVPAGGTISIESTGNGAGDWYHGQCMRAARGQSTYKLLFLPWWDFPEYTLDLSVDEQMAVLDTLREEITERELMRAYNLTAGQLQGRREKLEDECDGDLTVWNKEYPSCLDDCFQLAGGGVFQIVRYVETADWKKSERDSFLHILGGHPHPRMHYVVGGDVGAGVGRDSSCAEIFCLETEEQVGEYLNNRIEPDVFGHKLVDLGYMFNEAYLGIESNNHGILTLKEITRYDPALQSQVYHHEKVYRTPSVRRSNRDQIQRITDLGVRTSVKSKPFIIGTLRRKLGSSVVIHSQILRNELSTFIEHEDGSLGAVANCFDDTVMASGMAFFVFEKGALTLLDAPIQPSELPKKDDPFGLPAILKEMTGSREHDRAQKPFFPLSMTGFE